MASPLVGTKLFVPPLRSTFVPRPRARLGVTSATWLVLPLAVGLVTLLRSEVK